MKQVNMQLTNIFNELSDTDKQLLFTNLLPIYPSQNAKIDMRVGWECEPAKHGMYLELNLLVSKTEKLENATTSEQIFTKILSQCNNEQVDKLHNGITVFIENAELPYTILNCSCKNIPDLGTILHCSFTAKVTENN